MSETNINFAALPPQADAKPARDRSTTKETAAYDENYRPELDDNSDDTTTGFEDELNSVTENEFALVTGEGKITAESAGDLKTALMGSAAASVLGQTSSPLVVHVAKQGEGIANGAATVPSKSETSVATGLFNNSDTLTGVSTLLSGKGLANNTASLTNPTGTSLENKGMGNAAASATVSVAGMAQNGKAPKTDPNTQTSGKAGTKPSTAKAATSPNPAALSIQTSKTAPAQGTTQPETVSGTPSGHQTAGGQATGYGNETRTAKLEGNEKVPTQALENPAAPQGDAKGIPFKTENSAPTTTPATMPTSDAEPTDPQGGDGIEAKVVNPNSTTTTTTTTPATSASEDGGKTPVAQATAPAPAPAETKVEAVPSDNVPNTQDMEPVQIDSTEPGDETKAEVVEAKPDGSQTASTTPNDTPLDETKDDTKTDAPKQSDSQIAATTSQDQILEQAMAPTAEPTMVPVPTVTEETFESEDSADLFGRLRGGGKVNAVGAEKNETNSNSSKGGSNSSPAAQTAQAMAQAGQKAANPALQKAAAFAGQTPSGEMAPPVANMGAMALSTQGFASLEASLDGSDPLSPNNGLGQSRSTETTVTLRFNRTKMIKPPVKDLAVQIAKHVSNGSSRFDIRIDPPELGRIDVQLEISGNGKIMASLMVDRPETLDMLQRDARALERALIEAGLDADSSSLSFSLRDHANEQQFLKDPNFGQFGLPGADGGAEEGDELDVPQNGVHIIELDRLDLYV